MLLNWYPGCITCQKAKKWLTAHTIPHDTRHIRDEAPTLAELTDWYRRSGLPLKRFFNTSGKRYADLGLKDKLPAMTEEEQLALLASDGMLIKRPLLVTEDRVLVGFKSAEWKEALLEEGDAMNAEALVQQARASFDRVLGNEIYAGIIRDDKHLALLMRMIEPLPVDARVLDLGTGNGYLAFPIASLHPSAIVCGLDIADSAIARNQAIAAEKQLTNLHFTAYDGFRFPYPDAAFDLVVTRHALHHFPRLDDTLDALHALLKPGGKILVADPMSHAEDSEHFIDRLMEVKGDGHVHFYSKDELEALFARHGFTVHEQIITTMRFPFPAKAAYHELYEQAASAVRQLYQLHEQDGVLRVGQISVGNTLFIKQ